ncbi:P-loop NTPase fold protein [Nocardia sp. XZ_19_369]|uniref:KAP family P-loop NTPase fold protein n=1 Tax=Nocardia sp. XZ_19_369 TaxID=2769487 RepID=UPI001890865A|nr:P-loop NTPase fold protein [Nocardia sp. XZ_19_369]
MSQERPGRENGSDAAIETMSEDRLARAAFANRIAQRIARTGTGPSVVFGLAGPWGSGKTSMLSMIGEALENISAEADTDTRWSVAHFTPWAASDIDSLITEFYTAIASALPEKATEARDLLKAATPVATAVGKAFAAAVVNKIAPGGFESAMQAGTDALADQLGTVKVSEDPFQVRFDKISKAIQEAGTRVLVVVDDLDRLHTDELLAVMKAVRLLGRFPNVHYLLAYDKTTVLDLLTSSDLARDNRDRAHRYLEKIVQYPFVLPPIQRVHIEAELHDGLLNVAGNLGLDLDALATKYAVEQLIDVLPDPDGLTLRSIKQLCLQTDVLCSMVGPDEIDLFDAAVLTYIRLNCPDLYERIQTWRTMLLVPHTRATGTAEDWLARVGTTFASGASSEAVTAVYRMLVALFPRLPHAQDAVWTERAAACRISDQDYFARYFQFAIPEDDLSDVEVRKAFRQLVWLGELDEASIISKYITKRGPQWRKLMTKLYNNLDVVEESPSATGAAASRWVTRQLTGMHPADLYYGWGSVIFGILTYAVATAPSDQEASRILSDYCDEFGLIQTAPILIHARVVAATSNDRLSVAVRGIRDRVVQACLHDLRMPSVPPEEQLLAFVRVMDDAMWAQLRANLQGSGISQQDIAARFVSTSRAIESGMQVMDHFHENYFSKVVPDDELDLSGFDDPSTVIQTDLSISGRRAFAAYEVRRARPPHRARTNGDDPT